MKNMQFIVHGVPAGHQVWGTTQKQYFETFYGSYDQYGGARSIMVVETRRNGAGLTSYYTFIRPHNVSAHDGRPGGYFGMTLSVDGQYCTDVNSLYHLFEQVFAQKMVGRILTKTGESEKFALAELSSADAYLTEVSGIVLDQIRSIMSSEFEDIDGTFTKSESSRNICYNLRDVDSETFVSATKVCGKVYVSAEYPSKDAQIESLKSGNRKVTDQQKEYESRIAKMQKENNSLGVTIDSLKNQLQGERQRSKDLEQNVTALKQENEGLRREKARLNERISEMKRSADVNQLARRLEPSLSELLGLLREGKASDRAEHEYFRSHEEHSRRSHKKEGMPYFLKLLVNVLAGLVLLVGGAALATWMNGKDRDSLKAAVEELQKMYKSRTQEYEAVKIELESLKAVSTDSNASDAKPFTGKINVKSFSGGSMKAGVEYVFEILNSTERGTWEVDGARTSGNMSSGSIKVTPAAAGTLTVRYLVGGKTAVERKIPVEE